MSIKNTFPPVRRCGLVLRPLLQTLAGGTSIAIPMILAVRNGSASTRAAHTSTLSASQAAGLLADHVRPDGKIPVACTVTLFPGELVGAVRLAKQHGETLDRVIDAALAEGIELVLSRGEK